MISVFKLLHTCVWIRRRHLERHFLESNHFLGIHLLRGEIFCFHCGDYVYDIEFDLSRKVRALLPDQHRGGQHQGDHVVSEHQD